MQTQSKLMASAENLVNLDMKEGVKSMKIEHFVMQSQENAENVYTPRILPYVQT